MLSNIKSGILSGIQGDMITIETYVHKGLPIFNIVGLGDATVKEAKERVKLAIENSGLKFPQNSITVNLSPASIKKKGSNFDLGIAIGILLSSCQIYFNKSEEFAFLGELALSGEILPIRGIIPIIMKLKKEKIDKIIIPEDNFFEASLIDDIKIFPFSNLKDLFDTFDNPKLNFDKDNFDKIKKARIKKIDSFYNQNINKKSALDYKDVIGQEDAKRGILIAVSGNHGILMTGSPSAGKSMLAKRIPSIMKDLSKEESINLTSIYSAINTFSEDKVIRERPFRMPSTKITKTGLIGGGIVPKPGEITLAHKGVLFLDEVGEFSREVLDSLRVPMEDKEVHLIRDGKTYTFPSNFMLVGATNPCKCGFYGDDKRKCICTAKSISAYQNKISGPILDRIDLHLYLQSTRYGYREEKVLSSAEMRKIVSKVWDIQRIRFKKEKIFFNSEMNNELVNKYCKLDEESEEILKKAYEKMNLTLRTIFKVKKIARTIADMEEKENIESYHILEALQYRKKDLKINI